MDGGMGGWMVGWKKLLLPPSSAPLYYITECNSFFALSPLFHLCCSHHVFLPHVSITLCPTTPFSCYFLLPYSHRYPSLDFSTTTFNNMASVDLTSLVTTARATGHCLLPLELEKGNTLTLRITSPQNADALASLPAPPAYDADTAKKADSLRHRIRDRLGISYGPRVVVYQLLAALHGYAGPDFTSGTAGAHTLLTLGAAAVAACVSSISIAENATATADDAYAASTSTPSSATATEPADRVARLEHELGQLASGLRALSLTIPQQIAEGVRMAMAASVSAALPPTAVPAAPASTPKAAPKSSHTVIQPLNPLKSIRYISILTIKRSLVGMNCG